MDLDVMASVQENIIGNCLCVLGDSMAMPVGSMIKHFRPEFEEHMEQAPRSRAHEADRPEASAPRAASERGGLMARAAAGSRSRVDGREVRAPEDEWLLDAVKRGDVEVPFFCYEPKLGAPGRRLPHVPGRDRGDPEAADVLLHPGQGRHGRLHADRPRQARAERGRRVPARQPPARLPGLRQGRRVPAPGHLLRLGPRAQPLPRAEAQLPEADRALAAGRDRPRALHPLLPLRAVLAGGRRGLPARLPRARRPHLRRHLRRPALRGAVLREHHRAVPRRRAHLDLLPVPRPALGHRGRRLGLHALPEPVQHRLHRPRRARRARARARQRRRRRRLAVRQGPLGLPGGPLRGADHSSRSCATAGSCARSTWERALEAAVGRAAQGRRRARPRSSAGRRTNEEGYLLQRIFREALGSPQRRLARRRRARPGDGPAARPPEPRGRGRRHRRRRVRARARDATRSTRRRSSTCGCARPCAASAAGWWSPRARPTALDGGAAERLRFAPGTGEALLRALQKALLEVEDDGRRGGRDELRAARRARGGRGRTPATSETADDRGRRRRSRARRELAASSRSTRSSASPQLAEVEVDGPARRGRAPDRAPRTSS